MATICAAATDNRATVVDICPFYVNYRKSYLLLREFTVDEMAPKLVLTEP